LISRFPTYRSLPSAKPANLHVAEKIAAKVLCLPIYPELKSKVIDKISKIFKTHER